MKKLISLVLAIMLIASTLVCAIPLSISAAEAPIEATPLTGFTANQVFNKAYVNLVMPEVTKKFVTADGLRVTQRDAAAGPYTPTSSSQILIRMFYADAAKNGYALPTDFASKGSFIMYVNVPSANKMHWQFTTTYGANYQTTCESAPNATYEYVAVGGDTWSTATTDENGAFVFDGAFEGYIKVSTSSIKCLDKVTVTYAYLGFMGIRLEGIGGDYGEVVAGPLFVTTDDSTSTKIAVPDEFKPAPIKAIPLIGYEKGTAFWDTVNRDLVMPDTTSKFVIANGIKLSSYSGTEKKFEPVGTSKVLAQMIYNASSARLGYQMPADFASKGSLIVYVKTDSANKMHLQFTTTYTASNYQTTGESAPNAAYEYAAIGSTEWTSATTDENAAISFSEAFEGYVKIPASSFKCLDSVTMNFNFLGFMGIRFEGIGGTYGEVVAGPLFVTTDDSASTVITVDEQYAPQPLNINTFDFREVRAAGYNFSASKIENTNNYKLDINESVLSDTPVKHAAGVTKWSYVENADGAVATGGSTALVMTPTVSTYMKGAVGMVFYVKFDKPNAFSPALTFDGNAGRTLTLKPGQKVQVLANGSDEWVEKTVEVGYGTNQIIYGIVSFDSAFEGYIKVPFTSCNNDGGFKPVFTGDNMSALTGLALRFKGIGDDTMYGSEVIAGVTGYFTEDTSRAVIGSISAPEYAYGDVNYDWKVDTTDLVAARKDLLGYKGFAGYKISSVIELVRLKKFYADSIA